ncbi:uncharacterized protein METZ01_LOCUS437780, partial [marine metagenome]
RTLDAILSHGELLSVNIITSAARQLGLNAEFVDTKKIITTNSNYGSAKVDFKASNKNILQLFSNSETTKFITGFISSNSQKITTTLGRGGSDYTASIIAAAINAEAIEIWTDVDGVMTADPRKVKAAFSLKKLSYNEAMEMSHFGAKVIYPPTLQPVFSKKIPIKIKNTFHPSFEGTLISHENDEGNKMLIKGISSIDGVSLITVQGSGMIGVTGFSARVFGCLGINGINIIMITQASSEHSITYAVSPGEDIKAKEAIESE